MPITGSDTQKNRKVYAADTVALILHLESRKMGQAAKKILRQSSLGEFIVYVPSMALAEVLYLGERRRIDSAFKDALRLLSDDANGFQVAALDESVLVKSADIDDIPELHDRLIAATACVLRCTLLTNDPVIQASKFVETVW